MAGGAGSGRLTIAGASPAGSGGSAFVSLTRFFLPGGGGIAFAGSCIGGGSLVRKKGSLDIACDGGARRGSVSRCWAKMATDPNVNICFFGGDMWRLRSD